MVYSATVSQLINSIESHSITFEGHSGTDSIRTKSISNSVDSVSSCKSISEPSVLFSKAVLDLKRAAREGGAINSVNNNNNNNNSNNNNNNNNNSLIEYWDTWNYWKKHPFIIGNDLLSGQLLLEHLLILTNLKYENSQEIFQDIKNWLQQTSQNSEENLVQLKNQICAGFFLIFCTKFEIAIENLENVKNSLLPEYFDALKTELEEREKDKKIVITNPNYTEKLKLFFLFLKEIALNLLEKLKNRYALLVEIIKSNTKNFLLFCKKVLQIILRKLL